MNVKVWVSETKVSEVVDPAIVTALATLKGRFGEIESEFVRCPTYDDRRRLQVEIDAIVELALSVIVGSISGLSTGLQERLDRCRIEASFADGGTAILLSHYCFRPDVSCVLWARRKESEISLEFELSEKKAGEKHDRERHGAVVVHTAESFDAAYVWVSANGDRLLTEMKTMVANHVSAMEQVEVSPLI